MHNGPFSNAVLRSLDPAIVARLSLRRVVFEQNHEIEFPGNQIDSLFFVEEGMASMTTTFLDGSQVEIGMFGYESVIGVSALMGTRRSLNRVYTQIAGSGFSSPIDLARREFQRGGEFQRLALAYVQAQLLQTSQSASCNVRHEVDQRLARWLLTCADRAHRNTFPMSHILLSDMLGISRPTVSITAALLRQEHLIHYTRGVIHIINPAGLELRACECYKVIRDYLNNFAEFDSGLTASAPNRLA